MARKKKYSSATQDEYGRWWATHIDEDGNESQVQVVPTSGGEDNDGNQLAAYRPATEIEKLGPGANGLWNADDLKQLHDLGGTVPVGAQFAAPANALALADIGAFGGGAGPDPMIGLDQWLNQNNKTLSDAVNMGGLPLVNNGDGTLTYNPSAQTTSWSYNNPDDGLFHKVAPLAFAAMTGAGLVGVGAGAGAGAAEAAAAGGAMDMGVGLGGSLGSFGGITPIAEGVAAGAGAGAGAGIGAGVDFASSFAPAGADAFGTTLTGGSLAPGATVDAMIANAAAGGSGLTSILTPAELAAIGSTAPAAANLGLGSSVLDNFLNTTPMDFGTTATTGTMPFPTDAPSITQPPAPVQNITSPGPFPGTTMVPAGTMTQAGSSIWSQLGQLLGLSPGATTALGGIGQFGGSLLEWLQSKDNADALKEMTNAAADRGDPFGPQRPFYQGLLKQSYTDPNFFTTNPVFKGLNDVAVNDASRIAAARGFNNSSNLLYDIADRVQKTGYNYANQFQGQLGQLAGGGISPGASAQIAAQGAQQVTNANQQSNGALGATLANLPNLINGIKGLV